jgi:P4 family phage/plasmid primase-like protien
MTLHTLEAYLKRGFVLVPIPAGTKGPRHPGWNRRENCITRVDDLGRITGNVGLAHAYSGTCALDVDDFIGARDWLSEQNIDLDALLATDDAVQIVSGRPGRAKLLYRLETPLPTVQIKADDGHVLFELRCATAAGLTVQDVLPPSLHPETGWAYRWKTNGAADGLPDLPQSLLALWKSRLEQPRQSGGADGAIHEGGRNDLLFRLAASLRAKGLSVEAIEAALLAENRVRCSPPLPEHEVRTIARSAGRYEPGRDQRSDRPSGTIDVRDGTSTTYPLTELGNAQRIAEKFGADIRYVQDATHWLTWNDHRWVQDADGATTRQLAMDLPSAIYTEGAQFPTVADALHFAKWARSSQSARVVCATIGLLRDFAELRLPSGAVDADRMLAGIDGGRMVLDLTTGTTRPSTRSDLITKSLGVDFLGDQAKAWRWRAFLEQVFRGDAELIEWIQRWAGYILTGDVHEHIVLFLFGCGSNGKSVLADTLRRLLGDYARGVSIDTLTDTKRRAGQASPDLAALPGCRLAIASETEDGVPLAESLLKTLTGGDIVTARGLFTNQIQFLPQFKLLLTGNHRPLVHGTDEGIWRRLRLVPFTRVFSDDQRDPLLGDKLGAELPHILAWCVEGCLAWQKRGLADMPKVVADATAGYRREQDVVGSWLADCCELRPSSETKGTALYASYRQWALDNGLRPMSAIGLGRRLTERGHVSRRSGGRTLWIGIFLPSDSYADRYRQFSKF